MGSEGIRLRLVPVVAVAILYFLLGKLGFSVSVLQVSPVWPPSGMSLAAMLVLGPGVWPGVWLGALVLNASHFLNAANPWRSTLLAFLIATGTTLEALAGNYFVSRYSGGRRFLGRARHVFRFACIGAFLSAIIAALIGSASLVFFGNTPINEWRNTAFTWWIGDVMGILVVTPLLVSWDEQSEFQWTPRGVLEAFLLVMAIVLIGVPSFSSIEFHFEYMLIPCLMWAAFRFHRRGATTAIAIVSAIAIIGTTKGYGAFIMQTTNASLLMLQTYLGGIAITTLMLSAVLAERRQRTEEMVAAMQEADRARREAEEANIAKSAFLFNMNHELRTPLNQIIGYSDLLKEEVTESGELELIPDIQKIRDAGSHLLENVSRILDLSALETGKLEVHKASFSIRELIAEISSASKPLAEKNNDALTVELTDGPDSMLSDRARVREILMALLDNACKFTEKGEVHLSANPGEQNVVFTVKDTGQGIMPEQLSLLFRPFAQGSSGATKTHAGIGIGLATSRMLCRLLGGDILATSEPSRGSLFTVTLPRT